MAQQEPLRISLKRYLYTLGLNDHSTNSRCYNSHKTALCVLCYYELDAGLQECHFEIHFLNSTDYHKISINKLTQYIQDMGMPYKFVIEHTTNYWFHEQSDAHPIPYCFILFHPLK
jgi:hypothetical protein